MRGCRANDGGFQQMRGGFGLCFTPHGTSEPPPGGAGFSKVRASPRGISPLDGALLQVASSLPVACPSSGIAVVPLPFPCKQPAPFKARSTAPGRRSGLPEAPSCVLMAIPGMFHRAHLARLSSVEMRSPLRSQTQGGIRLWV